VFYVFLLIGALLLPTGTQAQATGNAIDYHGGPVMLNSHPVHIIWYGNWNGNSALTILPQFISGLNQSPYFAINSTYTDSNHNFNISSGVTLGSQTFDSYSQGTTLSDAGLRNVVSSAMSRGAVPVDPNAVYFVLSSGDVNQIGSLGEFCVQFCGFHTHTSLFNNDIKYAFVGNASPKCINNPTTDKTCVLANFTSSPNNNVGADGMASTIAHELSETVTDPDLNAWYRGDGSHENGDLCNLNYGPTFTTSNGSQANITLGGINYLIQQNWLNDGGGGCTMASTGNPFTFRSAQDELQACNGLAQRAPSLCSGISDLNDRQTCSAIASNSQTPCTSMTDRNMQLACYGMAFAPNFPSNCRDISNPQMQAFCYGASSGNTNSPNCNNVADANSRALCLGMALHDSTQCSSISNQNDRQFCLAVSVANSSSCSNIVTCPDPRGQATCTNIGNVWDTNTCTCSPPPPTCDPNQQQLCISQGGSWNSATCTCNGGCGQQIICSGTKQTGGETSGILPPAQLKSHNPLSVARPASRSAEQ
jgi:hypothetical protein